MTASPVVAQLLLQGIELERSGDLAAAEVLYRELLAKHPHHPEGCYLLGQLCLRTGRADQAIPLLTEASARSPDHVPFMLALGDAQLQAGEPAKAAQVFRRALDRDPTSIDGLCGLGCAMGELGEFDDAEGVVRMAVALEPGNGRAAAGLGVILSRRGLWAEAVEELERARSAGYSNASLLNDLGVALQHLHRHGEAAEALDAALSVDPRHVQAWMNLGNLRKEEGDLEAARDCYGQVLRVAPADCLRIRQATLLPPVYASRDEMLACRQRYGDQLDALLDEPLRGGDPIAEGGHNNFYLCYQGENDRELQIKLAQAYRKVYAPRYREPPRRGGGGRIRIGFVSAFFCDHTIGDLNRGIIAHLSRAEFEVFVFSVGRHDDAIAHLIRSHADHYQVLPQALPEAEREIASAGLDVLFYTDIGMEPFTYFLAFSRLAPVQCVTWGHPVTTGIDTIDYYLSSVWQEPGRAEEHYSERLVRLSLLPAFYHPAPQPVPMTRAEFGLPGAAHLYVCPQSLFKFHPDFDGVLRGILECDPQAQIVLPEGHVPHWSAKLRSRFGRMMPQAVNRIRFLPRVGYNQYLQLLQTCDVMLDPLHFGGGKTTLDALGLGVPIVTLPGQYMRGRATYACYRQMGIEDCIADDAEDYVRKAVRLAVEPAYRHDVRKELRARAELLAERHDMVRELEQFLRAAVEVA
jgi:protein O-GlcNAc transferase